jgi:hypothetical protein
MFRGQLYGGKLFFGQLFGQDEEVTPQVEIPLEYHGSGGRMRENEADVVALVLDKWRAIEAARAKKDAGKKTRKLQIVEADVNKVADPAADPGEAVNIVPETGTNVPESGAIDLSKVAQSGKPALPIIQTLFTPAPERVAPTRSTPATVLAPLDDGMEDVMTMLLALEEAGEL